MIYLLLLLPPLLPRNSAILHPPGARVILDPFPFQSHPEINPLPLVPLDYFGLPTRRTRLSNSTCSRFHLVTTPKGSGPIDCPRSNRCRRDHRWLSVQQQERRKDPYETLSLPCRFELFPFSPRISIPNQPDVYLACHELQRKELPQKEQLCLSE